MDWELHDGQRQHGPFPEDVVVEQIRAGAIVEGMLVRPSGNTVWKGLRSHAAFAFALEAALAARQAPPMAPGPVHVQTTQGLTGKFLDPGANARSCLGCIAVCVILGAMFMLWALLRPLLR